ncbi:MFS transporter [Streptomyces syringium]|uniref:MFS transporter n=1 Tax=Streptomyces syringium TaxID=76729 RepID=UPI003D9248C5
MGHTASGPAHSAGYRELVTRPLLIWAAVMTTARLPVAIMPLACVFLVREEPGGYALGAFLAAAFTLGEVVGGAILGPRLRPQRVVGQLACGLGGGAVAFAALGMLRGAHPVLLAALAALAGAAPAASPAGLRTLLTTQVPAQLRPRVLSAETMLAYTTSAVGPALVSWLALDFASCAPLWVAALLAFTAAKALRALPMRWESEETTRTGPSLLRCVLPAWPAYLAGAAALILFALSELALPALIEECGAPIGWVGLMLTMQSGFAVLGAMIYGLRRWPGDPQRQGLVLVLGIAGCVVSAALGHCLAAIVAALSVAGLLYAGAQVTRHMAVRERLEPAALAAGYSVMGAIAAIGYALGATLAGAMLSSTTPTFTLLTGVAVAGVLIFIGALGDRRRRDPPDQELAAPDQEEPRVPRQALGGSPDTARTHHDP